MIEGEIVFRLTQLSIWGNPWMSCFSATVDTNMCMYLENCHQCGTFGSLQSVVLLMGDLVVLLVFLVLSVSFGPFGDTLRHFHQTLTLR